jgi:hypothetical protein
MTTLSLREHLSVAGVIGALFVLTPYAVVIHADESGLGPQTLTLSQMDGIRAGTVVVEASAVAAASGDTAIALAATDTYATVLNPVVEMARGSAEAQASGDETYVYASTAGAGDGDIARVVQSGGDRETAGWEVAWSDVKVISVTPPGQPF